MGKGKRLILEWGMGKTFGYLVKFFFLTWW